MGGEDGPMNFAVKIRLGYGLGIYGPDSRDDLDIIRHVRNLFAHSKENMIFIDDTIIALCDEIKWINKFPWGGIAGLKPATPMKQYIQTVMHFFSYFTSLSQLPKAAPLRYADKGIIADVYS